MVFVLYNAKIYIAKFVSNDYLYSSDSPLKQKALPPHKKKSNVDIKNICGRIDSDVLKVTDLCSHSLFIQLSSGKDNKVLSLIHILALCQVRQV